MNKKELEEKLEEEETSEATEEEGADETDEAETKKVTALIEKKLESLIKGIKEHDVKKSFNYKEEATLTRSVMESDPQVRKIRPFVKLSKEMEEFVANMKAMARGEVVKAALNETTPGEGGYTVPRLNWAL